MTISLTCIIIYAASESNWPLLSFFIVVLNRRTAGQKKKWHNLPVVTITFRILMKHLHLYGQMLIFT